MTRTSARPRASVDVIVANIVRSSLMEGVETPAHEVAALRAYVAGDIDRDEYRRRCAEFD